MTVAFLGGIVAAVMLFGVAAIKNKESVLMFLPAAFVAGMLVAPWVGELVERNIISAECWFGNSATECKR